MIVLRIERDSLGVEALEQVKLMAHRFPGEHELLMIVGEAGRLTLGPTWRFDGSQACLAALNEFGDAELAMR